MLHALGILTFLFRVATRNYRAKNKKEGRTCVRPRSDEVKYAFTKALRRATRPTWGRCPSRAASKTSMPTLNGQRNLRLHFHRRNRSEKGLINFQKTTNFFPPKFRAHWHNYHNSRLYY